MDLDEFAEKIKISFSCIVKNYRILIIGIFAELLFFFLYGLLSQPFINRIQANFEQMGLFLVSKSSEIGKDYFADALKTSYFSQVILNSISLAIVVYTVYCFTHGFIWRFYLNFQGKREKYSVYIRRFFIVNILWFLLFCVYVVIDLIFYYLDTEAKRIDGTDPFFSNLTKIFLFIIFYFALISYTIIGKYGARKSIRESFKIGIKKIHWILPTYILIGLIMVIANYMANLIDKLGLMALIFYGIVVITPIMGWIRIYLKLMIESL
jgi:hypothetical protein